MILPDPKILIRLIQAEPYQVALTEPLKVGSESWQHRRGWILHLNLLTTPHVLQGEVAPLPIDWGDGNYEMCEKFLRKTEGQSHSLATWMELATQIPVIQSALLMALNPPSTPLALPDKAEQSALLIAANAFFSDNINKKISEGYRTFKLKISGSCDQLKRALEPLLEKLPSKGKVRLDPNQQLSRHELCSWLKYLEGLPIEFIEEPLPSNDPNLWAIAKDTPILFALDEQVQFWKRLISLYEQGWPGLFIVRPPLFGDPFPFFGYIEDKKKHPLIEKFVYASSFECFQAKNWLLSFFYQYPNERAIGLDPLTYLIH